MIFDNLNTLFARAMLNGVSPEMREALSVITDEMIEDARQRHIFKAIKDLDNFNSTVSGQAVEQLVSEFVDFSFLIDVTRNTVPTDQPLRSALQVASLHNDKIATHQLKQIVSLISSGKPFDRNEVSSQLGNLSQSVAPTASTKPKSFAEYVSGYADVLDYRQENPDASGLDIGLEVNIEKTALVVLGGQPGMGKTALALYINDYIAAKGHKTLMFSLEMGGDQLFERQVSAKSKVSSKKLKAVGTEGLDNDDWSFITKALTELAETNIYVDDDPQLSVPVLIKKCRDFKEKHPDLALITIDYLTLMKLPDASRRDLAVGEATRLMKLLAKELKTPVLLLSQINREADKAAREPRNSDLRDSGSIEQDADVIIFPYRPEVHDPETVNKGLARIMKTKVRDGEVGDVCLKFEMGHFYPTNLVMQEVVKEEKPIRRKF
jgi:replicative DNA helicase